MNIDNLTHGEKIILNAVITAIISGVSILITAGYPPTGEVFYSAILSFALSAAIQIRPLVTAVDNEGNPKNPPKMGLMI